MEFLTYVMSSLCFFFFFQAEDGIRDLIVTGVQRVLFRSILVRQLDGTAIRSDPACPGEVLDKLFRQEQFSVSAIENIKEAVAVSVQDQFAGLALPVRVYQNRRFRGVPVPEIVRSELVIPLELAGLAVQRQKAIGVEIVSDAMVSVVLLARIAGRPIYDIELGVIAAGEPGGRAAVVDVLAFPGLPAWLAAFRDAPEPPHVLAGVLLDGRDESL